MPLPRDLEPVQASSKGPRSSKTSLAIEESLYKRIEHEIEVACPCNAGSQAVQLTPRPQACGPPPLELVQLRGVSLKGRKGRHLLVSLVSLRSSSWNLSRATPACTAAMSLHTGGLKCGLLEGLTIPGPILQLHGAPQPRQPSSGGGLLAAVGLLSQIKHMAALERPVTDPGSRMVRIPHPSTLRPPADSTWCGCLPVGIKNQDCSVDLAMF